MPSQYVDNTLNIVIRFQHFEVKLHNLFGQRDISYFIKIARNSKLKELDTYRVW
jgi:hypothetical protein